MTFIAFVLLGLTWVGATCVIPLGSADPAVPVDVAEFKDRRDLCDHFRGEEPYDEERRKFLAENVRTYCTGTDRELALLKTKYKDNIAVVRILGLYEEHIEAGQ
jgi:hypothetical protein